MTTQADETIACIALDCGAMVAHGECSQGKLKQQNSTQMKTQNIWDIGQTVKVGFITLEVIAGPIPTPGNYAADEFGLCSKDRSKFYRFVPHRGLFRVNDRDAALSLDATI